VQKRRENSSLAGMFEKLEDILDVIDKRVKGLFLLLDNGRKNQQK
jgi:hypothetical protein